MLQLAIDLKRHPTGGESSAKIRHDVLEFARAIREACSPADLNTCAIVVLEFIVNPRWIGRGVKRGAECMANLDRMAWSLATATTDQKIAPGVRAGAYIDLHDRPCVLAYFMCRWPDTDAAREATVAGFSKVASRLIRDKAELSGATVTAAYMLASDALSILDRGGVLCPPDAGWKPDGVNWIPRKPTKRTTTPVPTGV